MVLGRLSGNVNATIATMERNVLEGIIEAIFPDRLYRRYTEIKQTGNESVVPVSMEKLEEVLKKSLSRRAIPGPDLTGNFVENRARHLKCWKSC